ncbi:MAG: MmgE/PrpD family protein [Burkholderiales bacterium]|nr:MmgE/PrpD family protein [Burkholderiales bacterium]
MVIADALARFAGDIEYDSVPPEVRGRAKHLLLDAVGIALASGKYEFARRALAGLRQAGEGDIDVIGLGVTLPLRDAVLMNGILVHGLDYDDTYLPGSMHLAASCASTALGVAAHVGASGRELLTAFIAGLEVAARLAGASKGLLHAAGFHPTSVCATFSAALIAGRLMGLTSRELTMAQGIALSTSAGTIQPMQDGSWTKRMHPGWAGAGGITAAYLARGGYTGPAAAYEGRFGFYNVYLGSRAPDADLATITAELGERWEFTRTSIKLYPACHQIHAFLNAAIALKQAHAIEAQAVRCVRALVASAAIPLVCEPAADKCQPASSYSAQFSLQYALGCALARGRFGLAEIEQDAFTDPGLVALAHKVGYEIDPNSGYPKYRSGEVIVEMSDGGVLRQRENILPDEPAADAAIVAKFMDNARMVLPDARAAELRHRILSIDTEPDAARASRALGTCVTATARA